ncbi:MAG: 2-hydroxyacid dehydrogenase [Vicinamibacteria bacterium]
MSSFPAGFRIVVADPLPPRMEALFRSLGRADLFAWPTGDSEEELFHCVRDAKVLLARRREISGEVFSAAPELRLVHVLGRYPDRVDLKAARRRDVIVATRPHGGAMAVADHTMALLLAVARKIVAGHQGVVHGDYEGAGKSPEKTSEWSFAFNWLSFPDVVEINGKTLGIVGLGEIGREVARRARGFDMKVLYHQRRPLALEWEKRLEVQGASLEALLETSDFVSLHAPHTSETESVLNADRISRMKPTAIVVNTARGGLVDEQALVRALQDGRIAGAGLDVFHFEPLPKNDPLIRLPNVVLSPHLGGGSSGGQKLFLRQVLENVARFARGEQPEGAVE